MSNLEEKPFIPPDSTDSLLDPNEIGSLVDAAALPDSEGRFQKMYHIGKRVLQSAVVGAEVLPTNEAARYGPLLAMQAMTHSPELGAAWLGGSTLLIEGAGALAASELITSEAGSKAVTWLNDKLKKVMPKKAHISPSMEAGLALTLGTPVTMWAKQLEQPTRSIEDARRQGVRTAAWLSGVCAVEGAMISEGWGGVAKGDFTELGVGLFAVGAIWTMPKWIKQVFNRQKAETSITSKPRYDLSSSELAELEDALVANVKETYSEEGVVGVCINPDSKFANFVRTHEASYFPEVKEVSEQDEEHTLFLALVDTRPGANRIVHSATMTGVSYDKETGQLIKREPEDDTTGLYTIDSLIELGNFTAQDFYDYYAKKGIDTNKSIAVETNFRIGEKAEEFNGLKTADLVYHIFCDVLCELGGELNKAAVFATINKDSRDSFDRVGLNYELLMGRDDLKTEESELGIDSKPMTLIWDDKAYTIFRGMGVNIPQMFI